MKQTAVEWFYKKLITGKLTGKDTIDFLYETAKEMEKEQIIDAWLSAWKDSMLNPLEDKYYKPEAEQYYKETFKSE